MSLQVTMGQGSLLALGMGLSDVATIYSLGRRFGNWLTASSGDQDFLKLLDLDEFDILQRGGLIDIMRFNKRWSRSMSLLVNGKPRTIEGQVAEKGLEKFGLFTAVMICVVAALDAFDTSTVVKLSIRQLLLGLLRATEYGEDIVASQYIQRINAWRSSAIIHGLAAEARAIRRELLQSGVIAEGFMPGGDHPHLVDFLLWLLAGKSERYVTASSDVAGIALCLSKLGIDILSISGLSQTPNMTPCVLEYSSESTIIPLGYSRDPSSFEYRGCYTTINLQCPEEAFTNFPIDAEVANRCRMAWTEGEKASRYVACRPIIPNRSLGHDDLRYAFYNIGTKTSRVRAEIQVLVSAHSFVLNQEICQAFETGFQHESVPILSWLVGQTVKDYLMAGDDDGPIWDFDMKDIQKINAFTTFQAFFVGYY